MPSPTDQQRLVHIRRRPPTPEGFNAISYWGIGLWKRASWRRRELSKFASRIDELRNSYSDLKDSALNGRLVEIHRERKARPEAASEHLEEGLALLAVVAKRELGLSPYRVQLMASAGLARGFLLEVDTGEGKTLALALTAAFNAWSGRSCHVITANDYLAGRDAKGLRKFYERAGLTVGSVLGDSGDADRRAAYRCGVTYSTAKEVAADYLRDRIRLQGLEDSGARLTLARHTGASRMPNFEPVQRGLYFGMIDEADNALIDEAVTPLIISRTLGPGELEEACLAAWKFSARIEKGVDYEVNRGRKSIETEPGHLEEVAGDWTLPGSRVWSSVRRRAELLRLALEAREFFQRDQQYVVEDEKVVIVDEATGRPMPMRTWRQGLHQMIEAKEGVPLSGASETIARISFQDFFRKYQDLSGASGTVKEVASEIWFTYGLPILRIPRNLPNMRKFLGWRFYPDEDAKAAAIREEVTVRHAEGQPVLVGVRSVDASETVAELLADKRLHCHVLNAKRHREEALMVQQAGSHSRITIATNMAGRGTDILLEPSVHDLGGLHVVASEPHESARVDRQLYGRAARHGDPGSVLSIYSAEDSLFVRFLPKRVRKLWAWSLGFSGGLIPWMGRISGRILLFWAQNKSQSQAVRQRKQVMKTETELAGKLGFSKGSIRSSPREN